MLIYLETNRIALNQFEFIHSYYVGAGSKGEKIYQWEDQENDRLRAAIVNAGFAANALAEIDTEIRIIGIESDKDDKDTRFMGEHDTLFALLKPKDDFEARRQRSLYFDYSRYLGRLSQLMLRYDIGVALQIKNEGIRYN